MSKPLSLTARFEAFNRDDFTCQYCGRHPPDVLLEVDHVIPRANGGTNALENLITACFDCNRGKGTRPLQASPRSVGERAAEIAEREQQLAAYAEALKARAARIEADAWLVVAELFPENDDGEKITCPTDYMVSIKRFVARMPVPIMLEAAQVALAGAPREHSRFLYFCKLCWTYIKTGAPP
jgi:HNH endonuclease